MRDSRLRAILHKVRRRQLLIGGTAGTVWALVTAVGVLSVGMWLDLIWELSPGVRVTTAMVAVVAGGSAIVWLGVRTWRTAAEALVARQLDQAGRCRGVIVSGWELSVAPASDGRRANARLTSGLAEMAVRRASELAADVHPSSVIPSRPARLAIGVAGGVAVLLALLCWSLPSLARTQWRRFTQPYADVPPFSPLQFDIEPGDAEVVYGQGLAVLAAVSGAPADQLELVLETDGEVEVLPMFPESEDRWRATLARITQPAQYFVRAGRARSARYRIETITVPRIQSVRLQTTPPAYTRDAVYDGPLPPEGIAGLVGTTVNIWAQSNRPLSGGSLAVTRDEELVHVEMRTDSPGDTEVTGGFPLLASGKFELRVVDAAGQISQESFAGTITVLADQRPFVRLLQPKANSLATPSAVVPVELSAEDDYGIARLQLYRSLNDSRPLPLDLPIRDPPLRRAQERIYLPLAEYGVLPGDEIKLFARVEDNDPAGPKGAESTVATIRIVSQEDFEQMLRARQGLEVLLSKYQQAQRRMERLVDDIAQLQAELAELPPDAPVETARHDKLQALVRRLREEAQAVETAAKHLLPYDLDRQWTEKLQRLANAWRDEADAIQQTAEAAIVVNQDLAKQLAELAERLGSGRNQYRAEVMEPLEHLAMIYPLLEDQARYVLLTARQRDIAERMASLRGFDGNDDPQVKARMRDLEEEQRKIREDLGDLLEAIETHAERLPDDRQLDALRQTALNFVDLLRAIGVADVMSDAENALIEFQGTPAHDKAQEAAGILESFLSKCQGLGEACQGSWVFSPNLSQGLGNTIAQLLAEAGLPTSGQLGNGMGAGTGGGYSARRTSGNNIGLYGGLPGMGPQGSGTATDESGLGQGASGAWSAEGDAQETTEADAGAGGTASGTQQGVIPIHYRQRVGTYLQRLVEELNDNP